MKITCIFPSCRPGKAQQTADRWSTAGYGVLVGLDTPTDWGYQLQRYTGYAAACNELTLAAGGDVFVYAGDDIYPDEHHTPDEILRSLPADLDWVMQPTGDPFGLHDVCCQSPWVGRVFVERMRRHYQCGGPYWPEYFHYFCDAELHDVAKLQGKLIKRPDLAQYHDHWMRRHEDRPADLNRALVKWKHCKRTYEQRRSINFGLKY